MTSERAATAEPDADEVEEAVGTMMTQIDCPLCSGVFDLEGDRDGEIVECPDCHKNLKIRRM